MSNFNTYRTEEESPSSDERMDTGSSTFHSQDTPNSDSDDPENARNPRVLRLTAPYPQDTNSTLSSDSDDLENGLRNPEHTRTGPGYKKQDTTSSDSHEPEGILRNPEALRLSKPKTVRLSESHNESLINKMSSLQLDSPETIINYIKPENIENLIGSSENLMGLSENHVGSSENHMGSSENLMCLSENLMCSSENLMGSSETLENQMGSNESKPKDRLDSPVIMKNHISSTETIKNMKSNEIQQQNLIDSGRKPYNLGISPPKFCSTLTLTTSHPLMGLGSPDYPDLIPKKVHKTEEERDLSLSSIEDDRNDTNSFYSPQRNTSKNNLYFTENFVTAESILSESLDLPPDVAMVKVERRKIIPVVENETPPQSLFGRYLEGIKVDSALKMNSQSTPKFEPVDLTLEFHSGELSESPLQLRAMPNFELPIEMSSSIGLHNDMDSPDVISSSTQEEKSAYQALLDPYTGSVALRHIPRSPKVPISPAVIRRKIKLPEDDSCSLDSLSDAFLDSEEEPIDIDNVPRCDPRSCDPQICDNQICSDDEDTRRSKSTNTVSNSDTIPEYSAAEELSNERAWLSVRNGERRVCDMKVIEPYKRVVSHGGYSEGLALVVFSACHLPDNSRQDYTYVMDNLFLYVIWTLERLVTDEYILVYLHGSAGRRRLPTFHWLHECYKLIDRRLRKSLKHLYLVHPTFWLKSFVLLTKPFISSKFFKKMSYVKSIDELMEKVPVEPNAIPEIVKQFDANKK